MVIFNLMTKRNSKLNSSIITKNGAHAHAHNEIIKSPFNKDNVAIIKSK